MKKQVPQQCPECKLYYPTPVLARKCAAWCRQHQSCNLEIIKHAVIEKTLTNQAGSKS